MSTRTAPALPPAHVVRSALNAWSHTVSNAPQPAFAAKNGLSWSFSHRSACGLRARAHSLYSPENNPIGLTPPFGLGISAVTTASTPLGHLA